MMIIRKYWFSINQVNDLIEDIGKVYVLLDLLINI